MSNSKLSFALKDTRGKESTTLTFVVVAFIVVIVKYILAGFTIMGSTIPDMTGIEFAAAFGAVLSVWQYRETKAKAIDG